MARSFPVLLMLLGLAFTLESCTDSASTGGGTASRETRQLVVGHFTLSVPGSWRSLSGSDKSAARSEFASTLAPGLGRYDRRGQPPTKMGEFEIFQKPTDGQLVCWTLVTPKQTDFLEKMLNIEDVQFERRKNMAGGGIRSGACRMSKVKGVDVVRVDVEMANGGKSTNLQKAVLQPRLPPPADGGSR